MQEFYESPKFRNKFFTIDDYIDWWCRHGKDKPFDYMHEIAGYNIPGNYVVEWVRKFYIEGDTVSTREMAVLEKLVDLGLLDWEDLNRNKNVTDFYIIGTYKGIARSYLAHEIRHALFYLIPEYKDAILKVVRRHPCRQFRGRLLNDKEVNYSKAVLEDEIHAYALTGFDPYYTCNISELPRDLQALRKDLKKVEKQFIRKGKIYVPKGTES
jgi:hypothetical protein